MLDFLKKFLSPEFNTSGVSFKDWEKCVDDGTFKNKLFLGIGPNGFIIENPTENPGLLTIGGQGSGKSTLLKTVCGTSQASSGDTTWQVYHDFSDKGMGDYVGIYDRKENACRALFNIEKIIPSMDLAYKEMKLRGRAFADMDGASGVVQYNETYLKKLNQYKLIYEKINNPKETRLGDEERKFLEEIANKRLLRNPRRVGENLEDFIFRENSFFEAVKVFSEKENLRDIEKKHIENGNYKDEFPGVAFIQLIFEEFHNIPNSDEVAFEDNKSTKGTVAYKLFQIARTGRSAGICILAATQKASPREFPQDLKLGISNIHAHKVSDEYSASAVDLPQAAKITINGRSISKAGYYAQCPYLNTGTLTKVVNEKAKPCVGILFGSQKEEWHKALEGSGAEGMIKNYPFLEIMANYQIFPESLGKIVDRLLTFFGFKFTQINSTDMATEINGIAEKNGKKYAVVFGIYGGRSYRGEGVSDKKIATFKADMEMLKLDSFICISFGAESGLKTLAQKTKGYYLDLEDLRNSAITIDNYDKLEKQGTLNNKLKLCPLSDIHDNNEIEKNKAKVSSPDDVDEAVFEDSDDF